MSNSKSDKVIKLTSEIEFHDLELNSISINFDDKLLMIEVNNIENKAVFLKFQEVKNVKLPDLNYWDYPDVYDADFLTTTYGYKIKFTFLMGSDFPSVILEIECSDFSWAYK